MSKIFIITSLLLFITGCSLKEYKLFQEKDQKNISLIQDINITLKSKIVPNDIIEIDIYNMNQKSNIMMQDNKYHNPYGEQEDNKYVVYTDGTIILPLLSSVKVEGLSIKELNEMLTDRYRAFLKAPYVKTTIKNHKIFVLGEVSKRGVVAMEGESISLIEVIAQSGGLTDHAMRSRIKVISEKNGKYILRTLDFSQFNTLNSRNLMLKNNSIVYIEPKNTKAISVAINDYLPIIQAVSNILSTFLTIEILKD